MTKTYQEILAEIAELERLAEEAKKKEVQSVIERILEAIKVYKLTAEDLGFGESQRGTVVGRLGAASFQAAGSRAAKFRDAEGRTWSGRGRRPDWLKAAIAAGASVEKSMVR